MTITEVFSSVRVGLYGLLFVLQKRKQVHGTEWSFYIQQIVEFFQLMLFVVYPRAHFAWMHDSIAPLEYPSIFSTLEGYLEAVGSPQLYISLVLIAGIWSVVFIGTSLWAIYEFASHRIPPMQALYTLRAIASFSANVGFIPIFELLLSVIKCRGGEHDVPDHFWRDLHYTCFAGSHLAFIVVGVVLATGFALFAMVYAFIFIDANPLSPSLEGCNSGRSRLLMLLWKVALILLIQTIPEYIGVAGCTAIVVIAGVLWVLNTLWYMPSTAHFVNQLQLAMACVFTFTAISAAVALGYEGFDGAIAAYICAVPAAMLGVLLANKRRAWVMARNPIDLSSPFVVDLWIRYTLLDALERVLSTMGNGGSQATQVGAVAPPESALSAGSPASYAAHAATRRSPSTTARPGASTTRLGASGLACPVAQAEPTTAAVRPRLTLELYNAMDVEERTAVVHKYLPEELLLYAEHVLQESAVRFPRSAMLQLHIARFYEVYHGKPTRAMGHLLRALRLDPPMDVDYIVYATRRIADSEAGSDVNNTITRLGFEKAMNDVQIETQKAVIAKSCLLKELCEPRPNFQRMHAFSRNFTTASNNADEAFRIMFKINPQNVSALRSFAQFNEMVVNDPDKAEAVALEADRLEEVAQKAVRHDQNSVGAATGHTPVFVFTEAHLSAADVSTGVIVVSASAQTLGQIVFASNVVCSMLGYTRSQLEHRDVSIIIPEPIASLHGGFLRHYLQTGQSSMIETTRVMLAQHRRGHLVLVQMRVRDVPPDEPVPQTWRTGSLGGFIIAAFIKPVEVFTGTRFGNEERLLVDSSGIITSGTLGALEVLGVTAQGLSSFAVTLEDIIPGWSSYADAMRSPVGALVRVTPLRIGSPHDQSRASPDSSVAFLTPPRQSAGAVDDPRALVRAWLQDVAFRDGTARVTVLSWRFVAHPSQADITGTALTGRADSQNEEDGDDDDDAASVAGGAAHAAKGILKGALNSLEPDEHASNMASTAVASQRRLSLGVGITAASTLSSKRLMAASAVAQQLPTDCASVEMSAIPNGSVVSPPQSLRVSRISVRQGSPASSTANNEGSTIPSAHPDVPGQVASPKHSSAEESNGSLRFPKDLPGSLAEQPVAATAAIDQNPTRAGAVRHKKKAGIVVSDDSASSIAAPASPIVLASAANGSDAPDHAPQRGRAHSMDSSIGPKVARFASRHNSMRRDSHNQLRRASVHGTPHRHNSLTDPNPTRSGGDDGAGRSVASSSRSGGRALITRLRTALAEQTKLKLSYPSALRFLWWTLVLLAATNAVMASVQAVVLAGVFDSFASHIDISGDVAHTVFTLFSISEATSMCMLDAAGYITRPPSVVVKDNAAYASLASTFVSNVHDLQHWFTLGQDPIDFTTTRDVAFLYFENVQTLRANIDVFETDPRVQPLVGPDGETRVVAPLDATGSTMLLGTSAKKTVIGALWEFGANVARIQEGLEAFPGNLTPTVCNPTFAPAQAVAVNSMSPAQLHERLHHGVGQATLGDSYESLTRTPLIVLVFMVFTVLVVGIAIVLPNLYATQELQYQLLRELMRLPPLVLRALAMQADWRVRKLRRLKDFGAEGDNPDAGPGDDGASEVDEDEGDDDDALLMNSEASGDALEEFDKLDGSVAWPRLLERIKIESGGAKRLISQDNAGLLYVPSTPAGFAASNHRRVSQDSTTLALGTAPAPSSKPSRLSYLSRCRPTDRLSFGLGIFFVPVAILLPFYFAVFATSYVSIGQVLSTQAFFALANMRAGYAREFMMDIVACYGGVGFESSVQGIVASSWATLVDFQVHNAALLFGAGDALRPIGKGLDANPEPGELEAHIPNPELLGVPGVSASDTAAVAAALLDDACPFVSISGGLSLQECYSLIGKTNGGLNGVVSDFISKGERYLQAKADQVAAARNASSLVPISGFGFSAQDILASAQFEDFRSLAKRVLYPAFVYITDLYVNTSLSLTAAQRAFVINFTAGFTSIFTVALVLLLLPRVRTLAVELRQRHALLLQLPMQVVSGLPLARNLVGAALAEYESALGGGGFGIGDASISDLKQGSRRRSAVSVDENTTR